MSQPIADELSAHFLHAAILTLRQNVVPALSTPEARINADLVTRMLYMLQSRFSRRGADLQQLLAADQRLLDEVKQLVPNISRPGTQTADSGGDFSAIETLERQRYRTEIDLANRIPQLLDQACGESASRTKAIASLREIVETQRQFMAAQDPDILKGSFVCYQGGRIDEERPVERLKILGEEISEANLTRHLQKQFPGSRVEKLSVMAGGFSKTTIFFTLVKASGGHDSLVIRKDMPVDFVSSVAYEYPLLKQLHEAGFPVAEPMWLEDDPKPFGGRFMVSRRVTGSTDISRWAGDKSAVENFARQLAKVMVDLHSLKPERLGLKEMTGKSAGELMRAEIERWYEVFLRTRKEVHPIEEIAMAWTKANIPATLFSRPPSLVHGDIGFHNLMIDNGRVTALLDWEFSHPGDAIEDLLYTKPFIEKVMDWEMFKSYYREYGGASCTAEEEFFYTVWAKSRNPISSIQTAAIFADAIPNDSKFAASGFILGRYLELEAGEMVVAALGHPIDIKVKFDH